MNLDRFDKRYREINKKKNKMKMVRQRYQLISSKGIDDQRILESDLARRTPGHI